MPARLLTPMFHVYLFHVWQRFHNAIRIDDGCIQGSGRGHSFESKRRKPGRFACPLFLFASEIRSDESEPR